MSIFSILANLIETPGVNLEPYKLLLPIALILLLSKLLCMFCKRFGLPQVVGMILSGILIGLVQFIPHQDIINENSIEGIKFIAEIGVILIMFDAGITTDLKQIKATGIPAIVITILGVVVPMGLGFVASALFNGWGKEQLNANLFYGVILTATSVSVTVAALKELGKLNTPVGTAITSAAILDDILGVIVLSVVLALETGEGNIWLVILKTLGFFVFVIGFGLLVRFGFKKLASKGGPKRRIPIFSLGICFLFAYISEYFFNIADITGAYAAGLILSGLESSEYVEKKTDMMSYLFFTPIFFAKIGITLKFEAISASMIGFGLCYVVAGMIGKLIGCGVGALATKFSFKDSFRVGIGMMCRAEVCLICASKGISAGLIDENIQPFIVILIVITSFITPLILKLTYRKEIKEKTPDVSLHHDAQKQPEQMN